MSTPSFRPRLRTEQWPCRSRPTLHLPLARCLPQRPPIHAPRCSVKRVRARTPCVSAFPQGPEVRTRRLFHPPSRTLDTTTPATSLRISKRTALTSCQLLRQTVRQPQAASVRDLDTLRHLLQTATQEKRPGGRRCCGSIPPPKGRVWESRARKGNRPFFSRLIEFLFFFSVASAIGCGCTLPP